VGVVTVKPPNPNQEPLAGFVAGFGIEDQHLAGVSASRRTVKAWRCIVTVDTGIRGSLRPYPKGGRQHLWSADRC
jgi:hypothetical protein